MCVLFFDKRLMVNKQYNCIHGLYILIINYNSHRRKSFVFTTMLTSLLNHLTKKIIISDTFLQFSQQLLLPLHHHCVTLSPVSSMWLYQRKSKTSTFLVDSV